MKTRLGTLIVVLATWPLITGGGGENPPPPGTKITGPAVSASISVDPHRFSDKAGQTGIRLSKGTLSSGGVFTIDADTRDVLFNFGCAPERTDLRFGGNRPLTSWGVPQDLIDSMFAQLGITVSGNNVPVITDTDNAVCTPDPTNTGQDVAPGTLSFTAVIQFRVPQH